MFIQVIQGKTSDADALRAQDDRWTEEVAPGAVGFLGSTSGVTDDGTSIAVVRFESEDAARRNSERPEQDAWWQQTAQLIPDATFRETSDTVLMGSGGSDDAGFVQVIQGQVSDVERMREIGAQFEASGAMARPDVLGGIVALYDDGSYTNVIYFTSEAAAREGEAKDPPPELKALMDEERDLHVGEMTFLDLRDPHFRSSS